MKILIVRTACRGVANMSGFYNSQEIGLARALSRLGNVCDIVLFGGEQESVKEIEFSLADGGAARTKIFYLKGLALYDMGLFFGLNKLADNYDIVQVAEYDQIQSWLMARRFKGKTVVYHGPYFSEFNKRYNLKCSVVDKLFVPGYKRWNTSFIAKSNLAVDFLKEKGISNVAAIGVGLDTSQLIKHTLNDDIARDLAISLRRDKENGVRRLLYIGRIEPRRNPYLLANLMNELVKCGLDVSLTVIGSGDEEYVAEWLSMFDKLGLSSRLHYAASLPNACLSEIYSLCEIFLLPTSFEIFGMVLLEAMYYGLVPVTTVNGGSSTIISQGVTGVVLDNLNPNEWANTVAQLFTENSGLVYMGENASRCIGERFTWDSLAPKFLSIYKRVLGRGRAN